MKIYEEQLSSMGQSQAHLFEDRVMEFIVTTLAGGVAREVSRKEIRELITEAHEIGLETEREVTAYVIGVWLYGETFLAAVEPLRDEFRNPRNAPSTITAWLLQILDKLAAK
jgi:hypothetical protein